MFLMGTVDRCSHGSSCACVSGHRCRWVSRSHPVQPGRRQPPSEPLTFSSFLSLGSGYAYDHTRRLTARSDTSQSAPAVAIWHTSDVLSGSAWSCCRRVTTRWKTRQKNGVTELNRDAARTTLACRGRSHESPDNIRCSRVSQDEESAFVT
jgi:hypothetical protein